MQDEPEAGACFQYKTASAAVTQASPEKAGCCLSGATRLRLILDNHSAHISKETQSYLAGRPQRFLFVFVPKHGSWLNLVENMFSKMARSMLREIRVQSKQELIQRIHLYFQEVNAAPVVFRWKYKMDEVSID